MDSYGFKDNKTKSDASIEEMISEAVDAAKNALQSQIDAMWNKIYPVGSIYYTTNTVNPSTLFGGTWEAYAAGRVLVGLDTSQVTFNAIGKTGGSYVSSYTPSGTVNGHALTINELPEHNHWVKDKPQSANWGQGSNSGFLMKYEVGQQSDFYTSGVKASGNLGQAHTHTFTGRATTISALQPFQVVRIWRRTA